MRGAHTALPDDPDDAAEAERTALRILGGASQSASGLQRRLELRGFSAGAASSAVERCSDLGYVNDAALARSLAARHQRNGHGAARVAADLRRRGVDRETIDHAVAVTDEGEAGAAAVVAQRLAERATRNGPLDAAALRRIAGALQRRGFSATVVRRAVHALS